VEVTLHPHDVAVAGALVRSPFLDAPSGNPLLLVPAAQRVIFVLLAHGEDPAAVGLRLLPGPPEGAAARALAVAARVARTTKVTLDRGHRAATLRRLLPRETDRWVLLLVASGSFNDVSELARVLGLHRSTLYRHLDAARSILEQGTQA
jgi:hypothetical protein